MDRVSEGRLTLGERMERVFVVEVVEILVKPGTVSCSSSAWSSSRSSGLRLKRSVLAKSSWSYGLDPHGSSCSPLWMGRLDVIRDSVSIEADILDGSGDGSFCGGSVDSVTAE